MRVHFQGNPMPGYAITRVDIDPPTIRLVGDFADYVLPELSLGTVNVNLARTSIEQFFNISHALSETRLGLHLRTGEPNGADVFITVERYIERDFLIPLAQVVVVGTTQPYHLGDDNPVRIVVRGRESAVNALTVTDFAGTVDLTGLGGGIHNNREISWNELPFVNLTFSGLLNIFIEPEVLIDPGTVYNPDHAEG